MAKLFFESPVFTILPNDRSRTIGFISIALAIALFHCGVLPASAQRSSLETSIDTVYAESKKSGCHAALVLARNAKGLFTMMESQAMDVQARESFLRRVETYVKSAREALKKWKEKRQYILTELSEAEKKLETAASLPGIQATEMARLRASVNRVRDYLVKNRLDEGQIRADDMKQLVTRIFGRAVDRNTFAAEARNNLEESQRLRSALERQLADKPLRRLQPVLTSVGELEADALNDLDKTDFSGAVEKSKRCLDEVIRAKRILDSASDKEIGASRNLVFLAKLLDDTSGDPAKLSEAAFLRNSILEIDSALESKEIDRAYDLSVRASAPYRLSGIINPALLIQDGGSVASKSAATTGKGQGDGSSKVPRNTFSPNVTQDELKALLKTVKELLAARAKRTGSSQSHRDIAAQIAQIEKEMTSKNAGTSEAGFLKKRLIGIRRTLSAGASGR